MTSFGDIGTPLKGAKDMGEMRVTEPTKATVKMYRKWKPLWRRKF